MKGRRKKLRKPGRKELILLVLAFIFVALALLRLRESLSVSNFDECVKAGYQIFEEETPQRCVSPEGRVFLAQSSFKAEDAGVERNSPTVKNIDFHIVVQSPGPSSTKLTSAVRSQSEWGEAWGRLYAGIDPLPPLLPVDFTKYMLVVVADGARPTTGFTTKINNITESAGRLIVSATAFGPGKNCKVGATPSRESNFYNIVQIPTSKLPVSFDIKSELKDC